MHKAICGSFGIVVTVPVNDIFYLNKYVIHLFTFMCMDWLCSDLTGEILSLSILGGDIPELKPWVPSMELFNSWTHSVCTWVMQEEEDEENNQEGQQNEEAAGGLSKSGRDMKKLLGKSAGMDESDGEDDEEDDEDVSDMPY